MRFALFYEIPVPRPWGPDAEHRAYQNVIEQAVAGERFGWDAIWTVEHHFLDEYSHCSNPEILYGAIAARTERIRLGYGVRLMPQPYNHPVRTAESVAVLDLISNGRVDFGTGRSSTRAELEGFGVDAVQDSGDVERGDRPRSRDLDPRRVRVLWRLLADAADGTCTRSPCRSRILRSGEPRAARTATGRSGSLGLGLCSFAVGVSPDEVKKKVEIYREALAACEEPIGAFMNERRGDLHDDAVQPRQAAGTRPRAGVLRVVPGDRGEADRVPHGLDGGAEEGPGHLRVCGGHEGDRRPGACSTCSPSSTSSTRTPVSSAPPRSVLETCRLYEEAGIDTLLCLVNPYRIPHEAVMETIELMGREVIPQFAK